MTNNVRRWIWQISDDRRHNTDLLEDVQHGHCSVTEYACCQLTTTVKDKSTWWKSWTSMDESHGHGESYGQVNKMKVMDKSRRWKLWTSQHDTKRCELFIMVPEWTQHLLLVIKNTCAFIIQNSNKPVSLNDVSLDKEGIPKKTTFLLG